MNKFRLLYLATFIVFLLLIVDNQQRETLFIAILVISQLGIIVTEVVGYLIDKSEHTYYIVYNVVTDKGSNVIHGEIYRKSMKVKGTIRTEDDLDKLKQVITEQWDNNAEITIMSFSKFDS